MRNRNRILTISLLGAALVSAPLLAAGQDSKPRQDSTVKHDVKKAGEKTGHAAKTTGHDVKKGTEKTYHATKKGTKKVWHKTKDTTKGAVDGAKQGAKQ